MNNVPVWILLLASLSTIFSCITSLLAYTHTKKTSKMQRNDLILQAYRDMTVILDEDSIEYLLDITEDEISSRGLTKKQLRTYSLVTVAISRRLMDNEYYDKIRNAICESESVEDSVDLILYMHWEPLDIGYTGRITMSEGFAKAWPLLSRMWTREPDNLITVYIEAGIKKGEMIRKQKTSTEEEEHNLF